MSCIHKMMTYRYLSSRLFQTYFNVVRIGVVGKCM